MPPPPPRHNPPPRHFPSSRAATKIRSAFQTPPNSNKKYPPLSDGNLRFPPYNTHLQESKKNDISAKSTKISLKPKYQILLPVVPPSAPPHTSLPPPSAVPVDGPHLVYGTHPPYLGVLSPSPLMPSPPPPPIPPPSHSPHPPPIGVRACACAHRRSSLPPTSRSLFYFMSPPLYLQRSKKRKNTLCSFLSLSLSLSLFPQAFLFLFALLCGNAFFFVVSDTVALPPSSTPADLFLSQH